MFVAMFFELEKYLDYLDKEFVGVGVTDTSHSKDEKKLLSPNPYVLNIENTTGLDSYAILFGKNIYLLSPNYGTPSGVNVTAGQVNVNYLEVLQQSASEPFVTSEISINVQSGNSNQIFQNMLVAKKTAEGIKYLYWITVQDFFSANQFQSDTLDVDFAVRVDGDTFITYPILANTMVQLLFYPKLKFSPVNMLKGNPALKKYGNPDFLKDLPIRKGNILFENKII